LHVIEPLLLASEFQLANFAGVESAEEQLRRQGDELVAEAKEVLRKAGFQAQAEVREGEPRAAVIDRAAQWGADLIVLGSHGRKGLNRMLMGSVAESVARHAGCSVEIVRTGGAKEGSKANKTGR
jgi:nucleotide-binding universal stress UspA family protein